MSVDEVNKITGVQATLIDTDGSGSLSLSIRADTGANNSFSISSGSGDLSAFNTSDYSNAWVTRQTTAADASFTVDGVTVTRSSNTITDLFYEALQKKDSELCMFIVYKYFYRLMS